MKLLNIRHITSRVASYETILSLVNTSITLTFLPLENKSQMVTPVKIHSVSYIYSKKQGQSLSTSIRSVTRKNGHEPLSY